MERHLKIFFRGGEVWFAMFAIFMFPKGCISMMADGWTGIPYVFQSR
jgi:hypothetical protein